MFQQQQHQPQRQRRRLANSTGGTVVSYAEVKSYLSKREIPQLFESLMAGLMYHRPENHINYLQSCLDEVKSSPPDSRVHWSTFVNRKKRKSKEILLPPLTPNKLVHQESSVSSWSDNSRQSTPLPPISAKASRTTYALYHNPPPMLAKPRVPVVSVLGGLGTRIDELCERAVGRMKGVVHISTCSMLKTRMTIEGFYRVTSVPACAVVDSVLQAMSMVQSASALIVAGFPRNRGDIEEYRSRRVRLDGVVLVDFEEEALRRFLDREVTSGVVRPGDVDAELERYKQDIISVAEYYDDKGLLSVVMGDQEGEEVVDDVVLAVRGIVERPTTAAVEIRDATEDEIANGVVGGEDVEEKTSTDAVASVKGVEDISMVNGEDPATLVEKTNGTEAEETSMVVASAEVLDGKQEGRTSIIEMVDSVDGVEEGVSLDEKLGGGDGRKAALTSMVEVVTAVVEREVKGEQTSMEINGVKGEGEGMGDRKEVLTSMVDVVTAVVEREVKGEQTSMVINGLEGEEGKGTALTEAVDNAGDRTDDRKEVLTSMFDVVTAVVEREVKGEQTSMVINGLEGEEGKGTTLTEAIDNAGDRMGDRKGVLTSMVDVVSAVVEREVKVEQTPNVINGLEGQEVERITSAEKIDNTGERMGERKEVLTSMVDVVIAAIEHEVNMEQASTTEVADGTKGEERENTSMSEKIINGAENREGGEDVKTSSVISGVEDDINKEEEQTSMSEKRSEGVRSSDEDESEIEHLPIPIFFAFENINIDSDSEIKDLIVNEMGMCYINFRELVRDDEGDPLGVDESLRVLQSVLRRDSVSYSSGFFISHFTFDLLRENRFEAIQELGEVTFVSKEVSEPKGEEGLLLDSSLGERARVVFVTESNMAKELRRSLLGASEGNDVIRDVKIVGSSHDEETSTQKGTVDVKGEEDDKMDVKVEDDDNKVESSKNSDGSPVKSAEKDITASPEVNGEGLKNDEEEEKVASEEGASREEENGDSTCQDVEDLATDDTLNDKEPESDSSLKGGEAEDTLSQVSEEEGHVEVHKAVLERQQNLDIETTSASESSTTQNVDDGKPKLVRQGTFLSNKEVEVAVMTREQEDPGTDEEVKVSSNRDEEASVGGEDTVRKAGEDDEARSDKEDLSDKVDPDGEEGLVRSDKETSEGEVEGVVRVSKSWDVGSKLGEGGENGKGVDAVMVECSESSVNEEGEEDSVGDNAGVSGVEKEDNTKSEVDNGECNDGGDGEEVETVVDRDNLDAEKGEDSEEGDSKTNSESAGNKTENGNEDNNGNSDKDDELLNEENRRASNAKEEQAASDAETPRKDNASLKENKSDAEGDEDRSSTSSPSEENSQIGITKPTVAANEAEETSDTNKEQAGNDTEGDASQLPKTMDNDSDSNDDRSITIKTQAEVHAPDSKSPLLTAENQTVGIEQNAEKKDSGDSQQEATGDGTTESKEEDTDNGDTAVGDNSPEEEAMDDESKDECETKEDEIADTDDKPEDTTSMGESGEKQADEDETTAAETSATDDKPEDDDTSTSKNQEEKAETSATDDTPDGTEKEAAEDGDDKSTTNERADESETELGVDLDLEDSRIVEGITGSDRYSAKHQERNGSGILDESRHQDPQDGEETQERSSSSSRGEL